MPVGLYVYPKCFEVLCIVLIILNLNIVGDKPLESHAALSAGGRVMGNMLLFGSVN